MDINVCSDPDILKIMFYINNILTLVKILLPLIIIVIATIDVGKTTLNGDQGELKKAIIKSGRRILAALIIFFIPTIVNVTFGFLKNGVDFMACFTNATKEEVINVSIRRAELALSEAEKTLIKEDYDTAMRYINGLDEGTQKDGLIERLSAVNKTIADKNKISTNIKPKKATASDDKLAIKGSYVSTKNKAATPGVVLKYEPDPSSALVFWNKYINTSNFVYPKDDSTNLPLGAWPSNYSTISTRLTDYKTYQNGRFIFPVTPENGKYHFVYNHVGIDIMAPIGTPIYSPVDGTMQYSEWGHTSNKGSDETAYSISIKMDNPISMNGLTYDTVFMTHMSGIRYRCSIRTCKKRVQKGELLGFVGTAVGSAERVGYAPHLHMTLYPIKDYKLGLKTTEMEKLYDIPIQTKEYEIKAGE